MKVAAMRRILSVGYRFDHTEAIEYIAEMPLSVQAETLEIGVIA